LSNEKSRSQTENHIDRSEYTIRPYKDGEEKQIVNLLSQAFGDWPNKSVQATPLQHWAWKYSDNPNRPHIVYVAVKDDIVVGVSQSTAVPIKYLDKVKMFTVGADAAVSPDHRRRGLRTQLMKEKTEYLISIGLDTSYCVTSNPIMLEIYRKEQRPRFPRKVTNYVRILDVKEHLRHIPMDSSIIYRTGYSVLKKLQTIENMLNPIAESDGRVTLHEVQWFDSRFDELWNNISKNLRFAVSRDSKTLNWKYNDRRNGDHKVVAAEDGDGNILGYVVSYVNRLNRDYPVGFIMDLVSLPEREDILNLLLKSASNYLDQSEVNTSLALSVQGHPYNRVFKYNGFLDSRFPLHLFLFPMDRSRFNEQALEEIKPYETLFTYGDIDSVPTSFK